MPPDELVHAHRRRWPRVVGWIGVVLALLLIFTAWQALHVRSSLARTAAELDKMTDDVARGDLTSAREHLSRARESAGQARLHTRGPVWWGASHLPVIGDDVTAVRTVARVADDVTDESMDDTLVAGAEMSDAALHPTSGHVDLAPISRAAEPLRHAAEVVARDYRQVSGIGTAGLFPALGEPVADLQLKLAEAQQLTHSAATAAQLLPSMLGGTGPRNYLVLLSDNAEMRSTGGAPSSMALMRTDDGQLRFIRMIQPSTLAGALPADVGSGTSTARQRLFGEIASRPEVVGTDPQFPRGARLLRDMWDRTHAEKLDGVMSLDMVALGPILEATGPVQVQGRLLTSDNVGDTLMRDVYAELPTERDRQLLSNAVLRSVLSRILNSQFDPARLVSALADGVDSRRLLIWSADATEQSTLRGQRIGGFVPGRSTTTPHVGTLRDRCGLGQAHLLPRPRRRRGADALRPGRSPGDPRRHPADVAGA